MFLQALNLDKPKESVDILIKRLKKSLLVDESVSGFFKDLSAIEEKYSTELTKLVKKQEVHLNGLVDPLLNSVTLVAKKHAGFASSAASVENMIKSRSSEGEWKQIRQGSSVLNANYEAEFMKLTKDYQDKLVKSDKGKRRGTVDKKAQEAMTVAETAKRTWMAVATKTFDKMEKLEVERIEFIKTAFAEYASQVTNASSAMHLHWESLLNEFKSFDPNVELKAFCLAEGNNESMNSDALISEHVVATSPVTDNASPVQQVDEEGYSIRPADADVFWSANDEEAKPKFKVAIQSKAIVESVESPDALAIFATLAPPVSKKAKPEEETLVLACQISETLNLLQDHDLITKMLVTGVITLDIPPFFDATGLGEIEIVLDSALPFDRIVPNEEFVKKSSEDRVLLLDSSALLEVAGTTITILKYVVSTDPPLESYHPISILPVWKCQDTQASLLLNYNLSPEWASRLVDGSIVAGFQKGGEIGSVQTKPTAVWDLDSKMLVWDLAPLLNENAFNGKLLARLETTEMAIPVFATCVFHFKGYIPSEIKIKSESLKLFINSSMTISSGSYGSNPILFGQ